MALLSDRVRGLLKVKKLKQTELLGVSREELGKWLCGDRQPDLDDLKRLAVALDATSDYLIGLGDDHRDSYELAAAKMSFAYFDQDLSIEPEQKQRCRRIAEDDHVLTREGAPRTAEAWKVVARMVDLAMGPPPPARIDVARSA